MKKSIITIILLFALAFPLFAQQDQPNSYVSLIGKFYILYPADWYQVPYVEIDRYLASKKAGRPLFDYDVVLAPKGSEPFYTGSYLFLTLDTVGLLSNKQIDSVVNEQNRIYGEQVRYVPVGDFMANLKSNEPSFDKKNQIISVYNTIVQNEDTLKSLLFMKKFYEHGVANFYFYSPVEHFEKNLPLFQEIVKSLNTEDITARLPREKLKVADIDTDESPSVKKDDNSSNIAVFIGVGIVFIMVIVRQMRKRKK